MCEYVDLYYIELEATDVGPTELGVTVTICYHDMRMCDVTAIGWYLSTDFIVSDEKGNVMHSTARGNIAHNFLRLKEGVIYSVKNYIVQPNKDDFCVLRFAHFIVDMDGDTVVRKSSVRPDGFARYPFQLVEFDSLEPTNNKYLIDAVGYVTSVGRTTTTRSGSKNIDFHLANNRGQSVRVTLWGGLSEMLIEKRTRHVGLYPIVLTTMSAKLYNNRMHLSSTSSTMIVDDEQIPVLKQFKSDDSIVLEEALDESGSSGTLAAAGGPKTGVFVPLTTTPSITHFEERHDSDGEESFVADSKTKGSDVGCSSEAGKRRRLVLDSSE
ncbi:reverse transcriptase domain-containing protein [Tanacetum coccineum]